MGRDNLFATACKTCRRGGRKCDRNLPTCVRCSLRGVQCEGYVFRWIDARARKSLNGKTLISSDRETQLHSHVEVARKPEPPNNDKNVRKPEYSAAHDPNGHTAPFRRKQIPSPSRLMIARPAYDGLGGLVQYYAREISEVFYLGYGHAEMPHTHYVLPMTRSIPSIRSAVAATAACHIANRLDNHHLMRQSLQIRLKATEFLRSDMKDSLDGPDLSCLICMLLLTQLDICSGDCIEFETHLKATSTFIKLRGSDGTNQGFIEQRIIWLDIMDAATSLRMPHWSSEDVKATLNKFTTPSGRRQWAFDVFNCPIDLFECIADITILFKTQGESQEIHPDTVRKALQLGKVVEGWDESNDFGPRRHMVEVWRLGTLLYLIRLFHLGDGIFDTKALIRNITHHARVIPPNTNWSKSTAWPLFQAGLLLSREDSETKTWLREKLYNDFRALGCIQQKVALESLEKVWFSGKGQPCDPIEANFLNHKLIL